MADAPNPQLDKFKDLARELKADENAKHFEKTVRKIVKAPKLPADDAAARKAEQSLPRNWRDDPE
jgi:hypothetical protein